MTSKATQPASITEPTKQEDPVDTCPYLVNASGEILLFGGNPILDLRKNVFTVEGLIPVIVDLSETETTEFGATEDVFDHRGWRDIVAALWSITSCQNQLKRLIIDLFVHGKELKIQNKGKTVSYEIKLPEGLQCPAVLRNLAEGKNTFYLRITYATSVSRVQASTLTPERAKCVFRFIVVPIMRSVKRMSPVSEALGYASLVRSLIVYEEICADIVSIHKDEGQYKEKTSNASYQHWNSIASVLGEESRYLNSTAAIAGSISKEIYEEDEVTFPGCIWWAGVHAMMTDASNKIRAPNAPADRRPKLEGSSFYITYKRKMVARNITSINTPGYIKFLSQVCSVAKAFINVGKAMTRDKDDDLDLMAHATQSAKLLAKLALDTAAKSKKEGEVKMVTSTTDPETLSKQVLEHAIMQSKQMDEALEESQSTK